MIFSCFFNAMYTNFYFIFISFSSDAPCMPVNYQPPFNMPPVYPPYAHMPPYQQQQQPMCFLNGLSQPMMFPCVPYPQYPTMPQQLQPPQMPSEDFHTCTPVQEIDKDVDQRREKEIADFKQFVGNYVLKWNLILS